MWLKNRRLPAADRNHNRTRARKKFWPALPLRFELLEDRVTPATHVWQGPAAGGVWNNAANWTNGVPTSGEVGGTIVQFNGGIDSTDNIAGLVINQLHFTAGGNTVRGTVGITLGISGLAITNNLVNDAGTNTVDASLPLAVQDISVFTLVTAGQLTAGSGISGNQAIR